jgi:hypothetical protein
MSYRKAMSPRKGHAVTRDAAKKAVHPEIAATTAKLSRRDTSLRRAAASKVVADRAASVFRRSFQR